jgi:type IV secretory pathway VirB10-like protein
MSKPITDKTMDEEPLAPTEDEVAAEMDEPAPSEDEDPRNECPSEVEEEQSRYPNAPQTERDAKLAAEAQTAAEDALDPEACPGCGCLPGDGLTEGCEDEGGCGYYRQWETARAIRDGKTPEAA